MSYSPKTASLNSCWHFQNVFLAGLWSWKRSPPMRTKSTFGILLTGPEVQAPLHVDPEPQGFFLRSSTTRVRNRRRSSPTCEQAPAHQDKERGRGRRRLRRRSLLPPPGSPPPPPLLPNTNAKGCWLHWLSSLRIASSRAKPRSARSLSASRNCGIRPGFLLLVGGGLRSSA